MGPRSAFDLYIHVRMLQQSFWLNKSIPQDELLKNGITEMYSNCRVEIIELHEVRNFIKSDNSFTRIFHGLCYNIYVFLFYHVDTAIFAKHLLVFTYDLIYLQLLSFWTIVLQHILSNNHFFQFLWLRILKTIASCKLSNFVCGFWYIKVT